MRITTRLGAACALALACTGCASAGELERGSFAYSCTAQEDPICWDGNMEPRGVPATFALAANFDLTFSGVDGGPFEVEPASTQLGARLPAGTLQLNEAGVQALLAREVSTQFVKDFILIKAHRSRALHVSEQRELSSPALETLTVASGEPTTFYVRVSGEAGATLAGGLIFSYRVEDEMVARVTESPEDSSMFEVTAVAMGMATNVYISAGGFERVFAVVTGGMAP